MSQQKTTRPRSTSPATWFLAWSCVGALAAFGVASLLTVGIVFLLVAGAGAAVLVWRQRGEWAPVLGLGWGAAVVVAYLGWLNRDGPGTVCHAAGQGGVSCTDEWAPWPFYLAAALLAAGALSLFVHVVRRRTISGDPASR